MLTYHPALHKVYEILRQSENILCVDEGHRAVFRDKFFISFRKAKSLKDNLVRAKLQPLEEELVKKGTSRCNGRKSCQICPLIREGIRLKMQMILGHLKYFQGLFIATQKVWFICCNVAVVTKSM